MKQKRTNIGIRFVSMLLCAIMILGAAPAYAAEPADSVVGYDFSSVDPLDAYDQYTKKESTGDESAALQVGTKYVHAAKHNQINTANPLPINYYRYGAFLRSTSEMQHYMFYNMNYSGDGKIPQNVLTIYADPEVNFIVKGEGSDAIIASNTGYDSNNVTHYKKSTIDGHSVYFIQFVPKATGESTHVVTFSTTSTTTQPHYSFWFGCPLVERKTVNSSTFTISVRKSNTSSSTLSVSATGSIPSARAWVEKVTIQRTSASGATYISSANMRVTMPGDSSPAPSKLVSSSMDFFDYPSSASASLAKGTYKLQLVNVKWKASGSASATYMFQGRMVITYLDAFGD